MRTALFFIVWLVAFPTRAQGLRNLKVGDTLPSTPVLKPFLTQDNKLILCMNSENAHSQDFFSQMASAFTGNEDATLFIIDTNSEKDPGVQRSISELGIRNQYIQDREKKIYGELGIIVMPTLILVNRANIIHSIIAGHKDNLRLIIPEHLRGLLEGRPVEDYRKKAEQTMRERRNARYVDQGFNLLVTGTYELALEAFKKAIESAPENLTASLGWGYTLLLMGNVEDALEHFANLKSKVENKRTLLGYYLSQAQSAPAEDNLEQIASLCLFETRFFAIIFKAASLLEQAGKCEESKNAYKHGYDVLLKAYRRK